MRIKHVIQIVSGSRSGSSLLKAILASSPDIMSLAGEEEPYFKLSGNGYGLTSNSDAFTTLENPKLFRSLVERELTLAEPRVINEWRLGLQYRGGTLAHLLEALPANGPLLGVEWLRSQGLAGHYDGCRLTERLPFKELAYEMPPYVLPKSYKEPTDTLLLKAPYNVYRPWVLEQAFPEAQFSYVLLTRNPAATINGLIDGWKAPYGFHKHLTPYGWWKFDLPPTWEEYINSTVAEKAWLQWCSSYKAAMPLMDNYSIFHIKFEALVSHPISCIISLSNWLQVEPPGSRELPLVMATEVPKPFRWKQRASVIEPLLARSEDLITKLEYEDRSQWT